MTIIFLLLGLALSLIIHVELENRRNIKQDEQAKRDRQSSSDLVEIIRFTGKSEDAE